MSRAWDGDRLHGGPVSVTPITNLCADHTSDSITPAAQLVSALAVVKRASRHFGKAPHMQSLTQVVTLELAGAARRFLLSAGSILGQDPGPLLERLHTARQLIKDWMVRLCGCQSTA